MKTAIEIKSQMDQILSEYPLHYVAKTPEAKQRHRESKAHFKFLNQVYLYAESIPSELFIKKQLDLIERKKESASKQLQSISPIDADRSVSDERMELKKQIAHYGQQLKFIKYILS